MQVEGEGSLLITIVDDDRPGPPGAPRNLRVTEDGGGLDLTWDAPHVGDPTGYDVQYTRMYSGHITDQSPVSDPERGWVQVERSGAETSQAITEKLKNGIMHYVRVRATNAHGAGGWVSGMGRPEAAEEPESDPTRATLSSIVVHYDGDPPVEDFRRWQPASPASYGWRSVVPKEFRTLDPPHRTVLTTHAKLRVSPTHAGSTIRVSRITYKSFDDSDPAATPPVVCTPRTGGADYQCVAYRAVTPGQLSHAIELNAHLPDTGVYIEVTDGSVVKRHFLNIDPPPRTYSLSPGATAVEGHDARLTLTLSREAPEGGVAFTVTAGYDTAGSADVGTITSPVIVPGGATSLQIAVPLVDDALDEGEETFTVTVAPVRAGWAVSPTGTATATVTIIDNDDAYEKYADLIARVEEWRNDPCCVHHKPHTDRWDRVLLTFGETVADTTLEPMTAAEAQTYADWGWTRWVEVTAALRELESGGQDATPNNAPTVSTGLADATIVNESGTRTRFSLSGVFSDADNDALTYHGGVVQQRRGHGVGGGRLLQPDGIRPGPRHGDHHGHGQRRQRRHG